MTKKFLFKIFLFLILGFGIYKAWQVWFGSVMPIPSATNITMLTPSVEVSDKLSDQIAYILSKDAPVRGVFKYAITDVTDKDPFVIVSVAGFSVSQPDTWSIDNAIWIGTVTTVKNSTNGYVDVVNVKNTTYGGGSGDILPFQNGTTAQYGPAGVHDCGFSLNGWKAVDLFPSQGMVYAAQAGEVSYICRDSHQMSIRVGNNMYVHLVDTGIEVGKNFTQGEAISNLVPGTFSDTCGNTDQLEDAAHVHFCFIPSGDGTYSADGYTLSTSTGNWTKGETTVHPTDYLTATWENADIIPDSTVGNNFWDGIVDGITTLTKPAKDALPQHQDMGIADTVLKKVSTPLELAYAVVLSQFNMTVPMWVISIWFILEAVRIIYAAYMWIKQAIPVIG